MKKLLLVGLLFLGACSTVTAPRQDECRTGYNIFTGKDSTSTVCGQ